MDKRKQKKLIIEIMHADEKDGLYEDVSKMETTQTAIEWLIERLKDVYNKEGKLPLVYTFELLRQAKEIEDKQNEKIIDDALKSYGIIKK